MSRVSEKFFEKSFEQNDSGRLVPGVPPVVILGQDPSPPVSDPVVSVTPTSVLILVHVLQEPPVRGVDEIDQLSLVLVTRVESVPRGGVPAGEEAKDDGGNELVVDGIGEHGLAPGFGVGCLRRVHAINIAA
jgi:hypothetical protein